jgi:3-isopropylmalate dehydrogenase
MKEFEIAVIDGDGIGPEIVKEAIKVIDKAVEKYDTKMNWKKVLAGGCAIDAKGEPLPNDTIEVCLKADSVLLGAIGGPKWDKLPGKDRPEMALLGLRKAMGVYANLRPAKVFRELKEASPLKNEIIGDGLDIMMVRELISGIYFGEKGRKDVGGVEAAYDVMIYNKEEVRRIANIAFDLAMKREKKLTSIDKANVLESSRLWRETIEEVAKDYPEVTLSHMLVDNAAMQLVRNPKQFDVVVTGNMFGDILSDEASMITGSIGMLASSSIGNNKNGLYEPIHGSAPDIAGQDVANPLATILSGAMMLRVSLDMPECASDIEKAVSEVLEAGYRTADIYSEGTKKVGTTKMGDLVLEALK